MCEATETSVRDVRNEQAAPSRVRATDVIVFIWFSRLLVTSQRRAA